MRKNYDLKLSDWSTYNHLIIWLTCHYPFMLAKLVDSHISKKEWYREKEREYAEKSTMVNNFFLSHPNQSDYVNLVDDDEVSERQYTYQRMIEMKELINCKMNFMFNHKFLVATFDDDEIRILKNYCPIYEIRDWLVNECNVKDSKLQSLFFKR